MSAKSLVHRLSPRLSVVGAVVLAVALGDGTASPAAGQVMLSPGGSSTEQQVLRASREWYTAMTNADREALDRLQTDDFLMVSTSGSAVAVVGKDRQFEALAKTPADRPRFERQLLNVKVRQYGAVAVLTALARFSGRLDDRPVISQLVVSEVWVRDAGGWRLAHFQTTDVPAPAPR